MFTGIILEKGVVKAVAQSEQSFQLTIGASKLTQDMKLGDSISINGVCLTVIAFSKKDFTADVMPETFRATNLQTLKAGNHVNLEPALQMKDRFGGHFVSGHVDGVGQIIKRTPEANAVNFEVTLPEKYRAYILHKGSIAVDGISLTVFQVTGDSFRIAIIPHTMQETNLGEKTVGDTVNLEFDLLVKNVAHLLSKSGQINIEKESENHV